MSEEERGPTFSWFRVFACNLKPRDMINHEGKLVTVYNVEADRVAHVEVVYKSEHKIVNFGALELIEGFRPV